MPSTPIGQTSPYTKSPYAIHSVSNQSTPRTPRSYNVAAHLKPIAHQNVTTFTYSTKTGANCLDEAAKQNQAEVNTPVPGQKRPSSTNSSLKSNKASPSQQTPRTKHPLFYVNRDGLPLSDDVLSKMTEFCIDRTAERPEIQDQIRGLYKGYRTTNNTGPLVKFAAPVVPRAPIYVPRNSETGSANSHLASFIDRCQLYMFSLNYNHTGMQFYDIAKNRSLTRLMEVAKRMIKHAFPIKCLEAVILGIHLTNTCPQELVRFTLSFKSRHMASKTSHYHVLLGVYVNRVGYGCIGMSRKRELAHKVLDGRFSSLEDLIYDIKASYEACGHKLKRISFGLPIVHDNCSMEAIDWSTLVIDAPKGAYLENEAMQKRIERFSKLMRIDNKT